MTIRRLAGTCFPMVVAGALACFSGCGGAERGPDGVARVGAARLSVERFSELLVLAQPLPLEPEVARRLARTWVDLMAVALPLAAGDSLLGPDRIREGTWLRRRASLISRQADRLDRATPALTAAQADSVYRVGDVRLVAHILRRADASMSEEDQRAQAESAAQILAYLRDGGFWSDANEQSEDPEARENGGVLGVFARGQAPPEFDRVIFSLAPGQLSDVVRTNLGFHILYRPRFDEVASGFRRDVETWLAIVRDSVARDSMLAAHRVEFASGAAGRVRQVTQAPWAAVDAPDTLAVLAHGAFTAADLARYLVYLSEDSRAEMGAAPEGELSRFLRRLVQDHLLWQEAEAAGPLDAETSRELNAEYTSGVTAIARRVTPGDAAGGNSVDAAARAVDRYLEDVVARKTELVSIPPSVSVPLLLETDWAIDDVALGEALERAARLVAATVEGS